MIEELSSWVLNSNRALAVDTEELTGLELIGKTATKTNEVIEELLKKLYIDGDFKGTWFGLPMQSTELGLATDWNSAKGTFPTVSGRFNNIDKNLRNAEMYGAIGDGVADDTTALKNAIAGTPVGGTLFLSGTYLISDTLLIDKTMKIKGGKLKLKAQTPIIMLNLRADNIVIEGMEIDGTKSLQSGLPNGHYSWCLINIDSVKGVIIKNCYLHDSNGGGVSVYCASRNVIQNNKIYDCYDNGILVANLGADKNIIDGNIVKGTTAQNCIFVTASDNSTATSNWIYDNIIINNICLNAGDTTIESGIHTVGTVIENNVCDTSNNAGILLRDCKGVIVSGNRVSNVTNSDGIALVLQINATNCGENIINGNSIFNAGRNGVYISMGDNNKIVNNAVNMNSQGQEGIKLVAGNCIDIINNHVVNLNPNKGDGSCQPAIILMDCGSKIVNIKSNQLESSINGWNTSADEIAVSDNTLVPKFGTVYNTTFGLNGMTNVRAYHNRWKAGRYSTVEGTLATDVSNAVITVIK